MTARKGRNTTDEADDFGAQEIREFIPEVDNALFANMTIPAYGAADFNAWVQERGLYFMDSWDSKFVPLLSSHDPGEEPQKGGLLRAQYGKGTYIYAGYAFFRQLPVEVPGAVRLYVNLLSAGHESK